MRISDRVVETSAKDAATEESVGFHMSIALNLTGISTSYYIHHGVFADEVLVFLAWSDVRSFRYTRVSLHRHIDIGVSFDDSILTISSAEDSEVR